MHHPPYVHNTVSLIAHRVIIDVKEEDVVTFSFQALTKYGVYSNILSVYLHTMDDSYSFEFMKPIENGDKYILAEMKNEHTNTLEGS